MKNTKEGGFLISKIHQVSGRIFHQMLKKHNIEINPAQGRILFVLWEHDEIPIHELSEKTQLTKSTLTSMLDRLEDAGFIKRIASKEDRRKIIIKRTEKDKAFQNAYYKVSEEMVNIFYNNFSEKEIAVFENYLQRILNNVLQYEK